MNFQTAYPTHKFGNRKKNSQGRTPSTAKLFAQTWQRDSECSKNILFLFSTSKWKIAWWTKRILFGRREERPLRPSFLHSRDKEVRRFPKTSCFCSQPQNKRSQDGPKEFSSARREDCRRSTSFLQACIKDVLGVTNTCSSGSQRWNFKKWKLHFNQTKSSSLCLSDDGKSWWGKEFYHTWWFFKQHFFRHFLNHFQDNDCEGTLSVPFLKLFSNLVVASVISSSISSSLCALEAVREI